MKALNIILICYFVSTSLYSQSSYSNTKFNSKKVFEKVKRNEKEYRKTRGSLLKIIRIDRDSIEQYVSEKNTNQIKSIKTSCVNSKTSVIIYFWFLYDELFKITYYKKAPKKRKSKGVYFFDNNSLFYKEEKNIENLNIGNLVLASINYLVKGQGALNE